MRSAKNLSALRRAFLMATACTCGTAFAQGNAPGLPTPERAPTITITDGIDFNAPPPGGNLDEGVTGIGILAIRRNPSTTNMDLCTATLINPRTVIFAAHCVNARPAEAYGVNGVPFGEHAGGTPIAVGFDSFARPALRQWNGVPALDGTPPDPALIGKTNVAGSHYVVEQLWYDPRSRRTGFLEADIALATLDTPAFGVPTWALLFSPLTSETHAALIGYGNYGSGTSGEAFAIDYRRRSAENMISTLSALDDLDSFLFGQSSGLPQSVYMIDFDDPSPAYDPSARKFDFNLFGGTALPREGMTAGGDSGGPLIVDQKFDRPVVAGISSGGARFFGGQPPYSYGTYAFNQPLFLFWEAIVKNNPYVYAGNLPGDGNWEDGGHWIQRMDPSYMVERNGALVNDLPDTPELGVSGNTPKFGQICFLTNCGTVEGSAIPVGGGVGLVIEGGPGSLNFVPDNRVGNPSLGIKSRYYDVTLSAAGTTALHSNITIDRFAMDGATKLDVKTVGSLTVLGDYTQRLGWTNVDGSIKTAEMLLMRGLLTGSGTITTPYLTSVQGIIAPGGADAIATLSVTGNAILASGSSLFIDASRNGADRLAVSGTLSLSDPAAPSVQGASLVFHKPAGQPAPRHGDSVTIATAGGGIEGTFGTIYSFEGVLRPELSYNAHSVTALLRAGSLVTLIQGQNPTAVAFAGALDRLRSGSYYAFHDLYGAVDLMGAPQLSATLSGLAPHVVGETRTLQDRQSKAMLSTITDRLSGLGAPSAQGDLAIVGAPAAFGLAQSGQNAPQPFAGLVPNGASAGRLPKGMTGFIAGGVLSNSAGYGANRARMAGQYSSHVGMGLEMEVVKNLTLGTAFGYAEGYSAPGADRTNSKTSQLAFYGAYRLGKGAYVAGVAAAETSRASLQRHSSAGNIAFDLYGAASSKRYSAMAESGVNLSVARGIAFTPHVQLGYERFELDDFHEAGGETALGLDRLSLDRFEAKVGAKLAGSAGIGGGWTAVPLVQADHVRLLSNSGREMKVRFANAPDHVFALPFGGGDTNWTEIRGGVKLTNGKIELGAGAETVLGRDDLPDDRAVADFTLRF